MHSRLRSDRLQRRGLSVFDLIRYRHYDHAASLCAFDLLELNGQDMRNQPLEERKAALKMLLRRSHPGIAYNRHFDVEGSIVFHHACKLGCEGIVSKRLGSPYRAGRSEHWIKVKNPAVPAVKREAEEVLVLLSQKVAADGDENHLFGRIHTSAMGRLEWVCQDRT